ncbi:hypothetical protein KEU06_12045 [Pseudaminobacter sp. 19-2017]|uniref:SLC26A/SulP transporter domain-containing protein n=1 Tax=Pseudaminobacter soli (ex Zhang et al. 2022) TaxID=2831468 RepID=A0A942E1A4_9HYPH|nr:SulP family inorganic anion transporter [Pseudaminobacter soli]MBS3649343.1 hypothetical protein [Pseudaminobacter soli]
MINAVVSVPDGLASAALAGVNPVYGHYTSVAAPIGGSLLVSSQLILHLSGNFECVLVRLLPPNSWTTPILTNWP